ncbi:ABC transporter ATP-binding protein [Neobacillus sp. OS1-2]|uniref:ABC transporter ATP-binding protein n=1 Tax=Neobacillus sp. OS1-2 TaxID=3070680 RepID=UPI0027E1199E|nr:ABC transporter ATP-binding protein [Neobacillus sp. OS1-2]WML39732.1 ABC transporter ATP-binding protein [Neobacillus sp. OS1-2]
MLKVNNLVKNFGGLQVTKNVSFEVKEGEILGIIGPNGAGKTTLFNQIFGFIKPDSGSIQFKGHSIEKSSPKYICKLGIGRTFQVAQPFPNMSVLENVMVGSLLRTKSIKVAREKAMEVLDFVQLNVAYDTPSSNLTISDRKRLEVAKALATEPELILLDEVMAGLNPTGVKEFINLIFELKKRGTSVLIIEHIMEAMMTLSDRILVLNYGEEILTGKPEEVANNPKVIEAYLGDEIHA